MERTLVIIKPDAVQRSLIGPIVTRFERRGLRIVGMKLMQIDDALARRHYAVHEGKPFYEPLIRYITSGPVVVLVLEATRAGEYADRGAQTLRASKRPCCLIPLIETVSTRFLRRIK